jgi:hypothetical protein
MQEVIPYLLILIAWYPDHPGQFDIERSPQVFLSLEECKMYGEDIVARHEIYKEFFNGEERTYICVKAPTKKQLDADWEDYDNAKEQGK